MIYMVDKKQNNNQIEEILNNPTKQRIIKQLRTNGQSSFGRIIKDLSLGTRNGIMHIVELMNVGIVHYVQNSSLIEVNQYKLKSLGFES
jgi:hypothetical protein